MNRKVRWALALVLAAILVGGMAGVGLAGTPTPNEVEEVAKTLYCPLCVGERLDQCEIPLCREMKREIAEQLAAGRTPEEIRAYFVELYGPVVLGEPPRRGIHWAVWVIPVIALVAASAYAVTRIRQWVRPVPAASSPAGIDAAAVEDEYEARVEAEIAQWEP